MKVSRLRALATSRSKRESLVCVTKCVKQLLPWYTPECVLVLQTMRQWVLGLPVGFFYDLWYRLLDIRVLDLSVGMLMIFLFFFFFFFFKQTVGHWMWGLSASPWWPWRAGPLHSLWQQAHRQWGLWRVWSWRLTICVCLCIFVMFPLDFFLTSRHCICGFSVFALPWDVILCMGWSFERCFQAWEQKARGFFMIVCGKNVHVSVTVVTFVYLEFVALFCLCMCVCVCGQLVRFVFQPSSWVWLVIKKRS